MNNPIGCQVNVIMADISSGKSIPVSALDYSNIFVYKCESQVTHKILCRLTFLEKMWLLWFI